MVNVSIPIPCLVCQYLKTGDVDFVKKEPVLSLSHILLIGNYRDENATSITATSGSWHSFCKVS